MEKIKKVFVVGGSRHYLRFIANHTQVFNIEDADIMLFTGGEDVHPSLYGAEVHKTTYANCERDYYEKMAYEEIMKIKPESLKLGVCRGAQFLTVMNRGKLIQNVNNHVIGGQHIITTKSSINFGITSTHHQMCYPFNLENHEYEIIAWMQNPASTIYEGDLIEKDKITCEPEIIYYPNSNCLGIQGHPENMQQDSPTILFINNLINSKLK